MKKYRVPLKIIFDGFAIIEANDESEAENIAVHNVGGGLGYAYDNLHHQVLDYTFDVHSYTELKDSESIKEIKETVQPK